MWRVPRDSEGSWKTAPGLVYAAVTVIRLGLAVAVAVVLVVVPAPEPRDESSKHAARAEHLQERPAHVRAEAHRRALFEERRATYQAGDESIRERHAVGSVPSRP